MRMVGKATKSKFVKAINVFANGDQPPLRGDVINHFLGTRLSGGIVHVLDWRIEVLTNTIEYLPNSTPFEIAGRHLNALYSPARNPSGKTGRGSLKPIRKEEKHA